MYSPTLPHPSYISLSLSLSIYIYIYIYIIYVCVFVCVCGCVRWIKKRKEKYILMEEKRFIN